MARPSRLLVLGASGMLGSTLVRYLSQQGEYEVHGSLRRVTPPVKALLVRAAPEVHFHEHMEVHSVGALGALIEQLRPVAVLNCIGLIKQRPAVQDPLEAIRINALLPRELAEACDLVDARLIHFSTDCVFAGTQGNYTEQDTPDAVDLYGRSKRLGEVRGRHLTLRTSIIGHELASHGSLIDWFRHAAAVPGAQLRGYRRAIFSGLPTIELARVLHRFVLPHVELQGLFHLSAQPIDKYSLLQLVAQRYGLTVDLMADEALVIDRSLDSQAFRRATGYRPASWPTLIDAMHADHLRLMAAHGHAHDLQDVAP